MNIEEIKKNNSIIFECIAGSQAYGTNLPTSDIDIRGIFIADKNVHLNLFDTPQQISDTTNDTTYFELKRYFALAADVNPNIIELLWTPNDCILKKNEQMDMILKNRHLFINKKAFHTFSGYAYAQIKKAKGQNKWINNPQPETIPNKLDFCWYVDLFNQSMELAKSSIAPSDFNSYSDAFPMRPTKTSTIDLSVCDVAKMEHMENVYRLYRNGSGVFRGESQNLVVTSIEKSREFTDLIGLLIWNEQAFDSAVRDWKNYWEWKKNRNESRYLDQEKGLIDFDSKNIMHCVRLLKSGKNILENGEPIVRFEGEDLKFLRDIRAGKYGYDYLMQYVEESMKELEIIKDKSSLPHSANMNAINKLYLEII